MICVTSLWGGLYQYDSDRNCFYSSEYKLIFHPKNKFLWHFGSLRFILNNLVWSLLGGSTVTLRNELFLKSCVVLTWNKVHASKSIHKHSRVRLYTALAWQLVLHNKVLGLHYFCTWFPIGEYVVCIWLILGLTLAILGLPGTVCSWCWFQSFLLFYFILWPGLRQ